MDGAFSPGRPLFEESERPHSAKLWIMEVALLSSFHLLSARPKAIRFGVALEPCVTAVLEHQTVNKQHA